MSFTTIGDFTEINVTGAKLYTVTFTGSNSSNLNVSVPGVEAGDIVLVIVNHDNNDRPADAQWYKYTITTNDYIYQYGADLGSTDFTAVVIRPA